MSRRRALPFAFVLAAGLVGGAVACGGSTPPPAAAPAPRRVEIPAWVQRTPSPRGEICAVGAVDRTFFTQDAHRRAGEAARVELAKTVEVRVSSVMYDFQSTRGGWVRSDDVVQVVESVADGVVHGAEVRATWRDDQGVHLAPGMTYALACLRTDVPVAQLAAALAEAAAPSPEAVEGVRQRAQAAFDELAREEEASRASAPAPVPKSNREPVSPEPVNETEGPNVPSEEVP